jgi:hypothetical protein
VSIISVRVCWNGEAVPLRLANRFYTVNIVPTADWPFGQRGKYMARAWEQLNAGPETYGHEPVSADGMLLLDGDVAIDPWDLQCMGEAISEEPKAVHVAPMKLWPISTRASDWVWGHGLDRFKQNEPDDDRDCNLFTFGFTYLPKALIKQCISRGMENWVYPDVDTEVCITAMLMKNLKVNIVYACTPKHLNF